MTSDVRKSSKIVRKSLQNEIGDRLQIGSCGDKIEIDFFLKYARIIFPLSCGEIDFS